MRRLEMTEHRPRKASSDDLALGLRSYQEWHTRSHVTAGFTARSGSVVYDESDYISISGAYSPCQSEVEATALRAVSGWGGPNILSARMGRNCGSTALVLVGAAVPQCVVDDPEHGER